MSYQRALTALADPTRRRVFDELRSGPKSVAVIAAKLPVSRPAVSQHLKVLREAGLVGDRPEGTRRVYYIDPNGLAALRAWLDQFWDQALDAFEAEVEQDNPAQGREGEMTKTITVAPVRKNVRVNATPERAFEVFTAGMTRWWSKHYSINSSPIRDIVLEPRANGRWFERGEDGSECEWGKVLAWEPPSRLLLAWQITPSWTYDPNLVTEVEIRFMADGTGARVELEHRLDGYGAAAEGMFKVFDAPHAWEGLLESFAQEAA